MNIAVDFDGVLFDTETMFRSFSRLYDLKIKGDGMVRPEELKIQNRYSWSEQHFNDCVECCVENIHKTAPIMPYAKQVLKALSKNNKIYAITGRGLLHNCEIETTNQRLKQEGIEFTEVVYSAGNKYEFCKKFNIDVMIDDLYENVIDLANKGVKCLYYRDMVLKMCEHKNVIEVRNWGDIAAELVEMGAISVEDVLNEIM